MYIRQFNTLGSYSDAESSNYDLNIECEQYHVFFNPAVLLNVRNAGSILHHIAGLKMFRVDLPASLLTRGVLVLVLPEVVSQVVGADVVLLCCAR